jgi:hypothetical protein
MTEPDHIPQRIVDVALAAMEGEEHYSGLPLERIVRIVIAAVRNDVLVDRTRIAKERDQALADFAEMTRCRDAAMRALYRDDVETDIDLEETISDPFYGPGWDWDESSLKPVVREAANAVRPAFGKLTQERDRLRAAATEALQVIEAGPQMVSDRVEEHWSVVAGRAADVLRKAAPLPAAEDGE